MHGYERKTTQPINTKRFSFLDRFYSCPRVEPANKGCHQTRKFGHAIFLYEFAIGSIEDDNGENSLRHAQPFLPSHVDSCFCEKSTLASNLIVAAMTEQVHAILPRVLSLYPIVSVKMK
jgi:hypothetical protein